ncbi:protein FAM114A2-like [Saccoglossus kowalevskii]|uniref:Protein FAM114A2-like n=1 Tax=Saccoglossus kowalevskii TaxID=10224 RepID=A0ABM0H0B7_SACKO|nr:PREDICTED: protein FAM114A2-like [Saccoglossus kowalevskii]
MSSSDEEGAYESADEGATLVATETEVQIKKKTDSAAESGKTVGSKNTDKGPSHDVKQNNRTDSESEKKTVEEAENEMKTVDEMDNVNKSSDATGKNDELEKDEKKDTLDMKEPADNVITNEERAPPLSTEQKIHNTLDTLADNESVSDTCTSAASSSWGGWGSSWLSTATASVSSFTQKAGESLTTMMENVEAQMGVPAPEDIIEENKDHVQESKMSDEQKDVRSKEADPSSGSSSGDGDGGFFAAFGVTAITSVVERTVTGGIEALEKIGKKTMDVLQESDPGLRKKRKYFKEVTMGDKVNLSMLLREAKEEAERQNKEQHEEEEQKKAHFGLLFDEYQGLAHLEALEMLSNQSENKVQTVLGSLSGDDLESLKTELIEIKDAFHLDDIDENQEQLSDEEFVHAITEHLFSLSIGATPDKLKQIQTKAHDWLTLCTKDLEEKQKREPKDIHMVAIQTLAELTAKSIEQFHKASELMLLQQVKGQEKKPIERAMSLSKLTSALCSEVAVLSTKFGECLNISAEWCENPSTVNPFITNVYLEASNSASYIQDAFQLVLPILQIVAMETQNAKH